MPATPPPSHVDVLVVGGGVAGLSAGLVLGRACRDTLIVDGGGQSNLPAPAVGGLVGWEGPPEELYGRIRGQLELYPDVAVWDGMVTGVARRETEFTVTLADGARIRCARVLLATGMEYRYPEVPGLEDLWGGCVFHCPYCHGWEMRNRALGVLGGGPHEVHRALLLREWSPEVVLLTDGEPAHGDQSARVLAEARIPVVTTAVERLTPRDGGLEVHFADGGSRALEGLLVSAPMRRRTDLGLDLGVEVDEGGAVLVGEDFQTAVPGLYAAGDVASHQGQVVLAAAAGARAGMEIHAGLVDDRWGWRPDAVTAVAEGTR
ncbi:MAG TPA: NAD(P)/FAD-dependent oxidoreductase [Miltoncostaeaceae bacterium]|nr:NAD(P)/FAD-dependent oxidoreductase [Miltoncostaeaceae bacterium]